MRSYPADFVLQHTPLMAVSGLSESESSGGDVESQLRAVLLSRPPSLEAPTSTRSLFQVKVFNKGELVPSRVKCPHSPMSPLTNSSPLYPDGILVPAWVQKHRDSIPSVCVMFKRLGKDSSDTNLCYDANELRRSAQDRGIKFALVLILEASPANNAAVEERIMFIKRSCSLDSKNSLFILPPLSGSPTELSDFVHGLQKHLFENATAYYREHGRRIKKKKLKISTKGQSATPLEAHPNLIDIGTETANAKPLSAVGWNVRYDYKLAVFAEFRQDAEAALSHYKAAYQSLVEMFNSNTIAPDRTTYLIPHSSRWSEARILADCISIKICKLSLYSDASVEAVKQHRKHIENFKHLPEFANSLVESLNCTPGLSWLSSSVTGGGSFEYWAWTSKQCRVFGELVEVATSKLGLHLPYPPPGSYSTMASASMAHFGPPSPDVQNFPQDAHSLKGGHSIATRLVLQHAGFYYYVAALCAEERWKRFEEVLTKYTANNVTNSPGYVSKSISAEKSTDHGTLIIELLTKSYEQFKKQRSGRMTLFLASEIARIYERSGKREMALKFFERISKTYRKEKWPSVLAALLKLSVTCGRALGRWEFVTECLIELLSPTISVESEERQTILSELLSVLNNEIVNPVELDMDRFDSFIECTAEFQSNSLFVGDDAKFQIVLTPSCNGEGVPNVIRFERVHVRFSNSDWDQVWTHSSEAPSHSEKNIRFMHCSNGGVSDLSIHPGLASVWEGSVCTASSEKVVLESVSFYLKGNHGGIWLVYKLLQKKSGGYGRRWLEPGSKTHHIKSKSCESSPSVVVTKRKPNVGIRMESKPLLLDEIHPVLVHISNESNTDISGSVSFDFRSIIHQGSQDRNSRVATQVSSLVGVAYEATLQGSTASSATSINLFDETNTGSHGKENVRLSTGTKFPENHDVSNVSVGKVKAGSSITIELFVLALKHTAERCLSIHFDFDLAESDNGTTQFSLSEVFKISCSEPFEVSLEERPSAQKVFSNRAGRVISGSSEAGLFMHATEGGVLSVHHGWSFVCSIKNHSSIPIFLSEAKFATSESIPAGVELRVENLGFGHGQICLQSGDTRIYVVHCSISSSALKDLPLFSIGLIDLSWKRADSLVNQLSRTRIPIPEVQELYPSCWAIVEFPGTVIVDKPFSMTYIIQNCSMAMVEVNLTVEPSESFVFTGLKALQGVHILPYAEKVIHFLVVPLAIGSCKLPNVKITKRSVHLPEKNEVGVASVFDEIVSVYLLGGGRFDEFLVHVWPASNDSQK